MLFSMNLFVFLHDTRAQMIDHRSKNKCFLTYIVVKWMLFSVYELMFLHNTLAQK
jgi:hypothetical protein